MRAVTLRKGRSTLSAILFSVFFLLTVFASFVKPASAEIDRWVFCDIIPEPGAQIYQYAKTDDLPFELRSKSATTYGLDEVDSTLANSILYYTGMDFPSNNANVLGRALNGDIVDPGAPGKPKPNAGVKLSPFDRFGLAGLHFTSYMGEWRYYKVDACKASPPQDIHANLFYKNRLTPQPTYSDVGNSIDPRVVQFNKSSAAHLTSAAFNLIANFLFSITKMVVAITIAMLNLAFTDIATTFGFADIIGGSNGLFTVLSNGVFMPLISIAFLSLAVWLFVTAGVKGRAREGFISLATSLLMLVVAFVMILNPMAAVTLPSKIVLFGQSFIAAASNSTLAKGEGICETNVGDAQKLVTLPSGEQTLQPNTAGELEKIGKTASAAVGCRLWESLLLKPWSEGQFGVEYTDLWGKGAVPPGSSGKELGNVNSDMTGDAEVPLGDGASVKNWAIYHISTMTNAHSLTEQPDAVPSVAGGVNTDWWRIVDALSNYQEEDKTVDPGIGEPVTYKTPKKNPVSPYWDTWVGNSAYSRVSIAFMSIVYALIMSVLPLLTAGTVVALKISLTLFVGVAPVFLLFGLVPGKGQDLFRSWLELTINTILKILAVTFLLMLVILFTVQFLSQVHQFGWIKTMLLMAVFTFIFWKSKEQLYSTFASVRISSGGLGNVAHSIGQKIKDTTTGVRKAATTTAVTSVAAGVASQQAGQGFSSGAKAGLKRGIQNFAYSHQNSFSRAFSQAREAQDIHESEIPIEKMTCNSCHRPLTESVLGGEKSTVFQGARDDNGNFYCWECYLSDQAEDDTLTTVTYDWSDKEKPKHRSETPRFLQQKPENRKHVSSKFIGKRESEILYGVTDKGMLLDNNARAHAISQIMEIVAKELEAHHQLRESVDSGDKQSVAKLEYPDPPPLIRDYVNTQVIDEAFKSGDYEYIFASYVTAYAAAMSDTVGVDEGESSEVTGLPEVIPVSANDIFAAVMEDVTFIEATKRVQLITEEPSDL